MTAGPPVDRFTRTLRWMRDGEVFVAERLRAAYESGFERPSLLPGWDRAHLAAHLAGNADALGNLLHWARTGRETLMYASPEARKADIEQRAARPYEEIYMAAGVAADRLARAVDELPREAWAAPVRTAQGRGITAAEVPWMRTRETWIHAADLDAGTGFDAFPADLIDALLTEVTSTLSAREGCPAMLLAPTDREFSWTLGAGGTPPVARPAADLLGWVLGRTRPAGLPEPPRWL